MKDIREYIQSGILEWYVLGVATPEEAAEVERLAVAHPEISQELATISQTLEAYALAHAVEPKATIKPLILATIDYQQRLQNGEAVSIPPVLTPTSQVTDYATWLNRPDMILPANAEAIHVKLIGATAAATTAIVWLTGVTGNEVHHQEYERFLIVEGSCDIIVGEEIHHLVPGSFYEVPLHAKHMVKVTSAMPCKVILQRIAA